MIKRMKKGIEDLGEIIGSFAELLTASSGAVKTRHKIDDIKFKRLLVERAWDSLMKGEITEFEVGDVHIVGSRSPDKEEQHPPEPSETKI